MTVHPVPSVAASSHSEVLECVLVMPAYNEEGCIADVIRGWAMELRARFGEEFRLVVVNDGSRDRTGAILDGLAREEPRLCVVHQANAGHGGALLRGYREAVAMDPTRVFQVDSDNQFAPSDFGLLWERRAESPCILGDRSERHDALHRLVITRLVRVVIFCLYGCYLRDSNIPFRLLDTTFLLSALALIPTTTFAPNIFLAVIAARRGANLLGIPVTHRDRTTGTVSIVRWKLIKICFRCVQELFEFRRVLARASSTEKESRRKL